MTRVVVAVDPPGGATEAGIVAAGLTNHCPCGAGAHVFRSGWYFMEGLPGYLGSHST